jgi:hypothetical protein
MCGSPMAWALKNTWETQRSILFWASKPYIQQCSVLRVQDTEIRDYNNGDQEFGRGLLDGILWVHRWCSSTASNKSTLSSWVVEFVWLAWDHVLFDPLLGADSHLIF